MDGAENINSNVDTSRLRPLQNQRIREGNTDRSQGQSDKGEAAVKVRLSTQAREALKEREAQGGGEERYDPSKVEKAQQQLADWQGLTDGQLNSIAQRLSDLE